MLAPRPLVPAVPPHALARFGGLLRDLDRPRLALSRVTPNWFASVMGTGIVAVAAASLPVQPRGLRGAATVVWGVAAVLLVVLAVATAAHWVLFRGVARSHVRDAGMAPFYGAVPMALLTVGAATNLLGRDVLGARLAIDLDRGLWTVGTLLGLGTAVVVPVLVIRRHRPRPADAFGGWLMPVVPPMVSASTGALLLASTPAGSARTALLVACYALFAGSLAASAAVIVLVVRRLVVHGPGPTPRVPTLWIVLGPLGQSVTAANLLGGAASGVVPARYARPLRTFGVAYGVPVWGLAVLWAVVAAVVTVRVARRTPDGRLPFSLTWWSFTFPVGTVVTGASGLFAHTGDPALRWVAAALYAGLVVAWAVVGSRTARGAWHGRLLVA